MPEGIGYGHGEQKQAWVKAPPVRRGTPAPRPNGVKTKITDLIPFRGKR